MRPVAATWFEALAAHADAASALEALARTGAVELEYQPHGRTLVPMAELRALLDEYAALAQRYAPYWPPAARAAAAAPAVPARQMEIALEALRAHAREADPHVERLQALAGERTELETWRMIAAQFAGRELDFGRLREAPFALERRVYVFGAPAALAAPAPLVAVPFFAAGHAGLVVIGPRAALDEYQVHAAGYKGRALALPPALRGDAAESARAIDARIEENGREAAELRARLERLAEAHSMAGHLAAIERLAWFARTAPALGASEQFVSITGWTDDAPGARLEQALERANVRAVVHFPRPPAGAEPPLVLRNPAWARPFEVFAAALGVPGRDEADPSRLLAFVVPLLFGYMFGDVGQGLVLAAAGLALRRRFPIARLLVAGGAASATFGWVFGSAFGQEGWIAPLWLHSLDEPLAVLAVPLAGGALLLAAGLALQALQAHWSGALGRWVLGDAGVAIAYVGLAAAPVYLPALWLCAAGALWQLAGRWLLERRAAALGAGAAAFAEQLFQLAVNTLSFVRVGAFALAHAGLGSAVNALAEGLHPAASVAAIVLGNAIVIALEVLVVSVQTTRLVLFEFFIRFLRGAGRPFRPIGEPPSTTLGRPT